MIAAEVTGTEAVRHCQEVLGLISEKLGIQEFCYAAPDLATADWTLRLLFEKPRHSSAACRTGILCLIKPHAVREGRNYNTLTEKAAQLNFSLISCLFRLGAADNQIHY